MLLLKFLLEKCFLFAHIFFTCFTLEKRTQNHLFSFKIYLQKIVIFFPFINMNITIYSCGFQNGIYYIIDMSADEIVLKHFKLVIYTRAGPIVLQFGLNSEEQCNFEMPHFIVYIKGNNFCVISRIFFLKEVFFI